MKKLLLLLLLASCNPKAKKDDSMTQYKKDSAKIEDKFKKVQSLVDAGYSIEQAESILTASDSLADIEFKSLGK